MKKDGIEKFVLVALTVILVGYAVMEFYIMSSNEKINQLQSEIQAKEKTVNELYNLKKDYKKLEQKIINKETELSALEEKLPSYNCNSELINYFYQMYKSDQLKISTINTGIDEETVTGGIGRISIQSIGSTKDISDILRYIKENKRSLTITMFNLQSNADDTYTATMNVQWAYEKN